MGGCACEIKACESEFLDMDNIRFQTTNCQEDEKTINNIIKLQSLFRGYRLRSLLKKSYNLKNPTFNKSLTTQNNQFSQIKNINFSQKTLTSKITDEEIRDLLINYPPLIFQNENLQFKKKINLENFTQYYGEFDINTGKRYGRGIQLWNDGSRYEGYWINDKTNIKGKLKHNDGDIYDGEWYDDKANGHGIYFYKDGSKYDGEWKNDKKEGYGIETGNDGSKYTGFYKNGMKNGKGKYEHNDGSFYEGNFVDDYIEGKGLYIWSDGKKYEGEWKNNKMDGYGIFIWPDGRKYEGNYKCGKKNGYGVFRWKDDGKIYRGEWKNGKQNGKADYYNGDIWRKSIWFEGKKIKYVDDYDNEKGGNINTDNGDINENSCKDQKKMFDEDKNNNDDNNEQND